VGVFDVYYAEIHRYAAKRLGPDAAADVAGVGGEAQPRDRAIGRLLFYSGVRVAELVALDVDVFEGTAWHQVFKLPPKQKKSFLVSAYRQSLKDAGFPYVTSFEMLDENTHPLHLVHGTSHPSGLEKMKNAMWAVDRIAGRQFRDPRDPGQGMLEIKEPDFSSLRRALLDKLAEGPQTVAQLQHYTLHETVYRSQHVWPLVQELLRAELIERAVPGHMSNDTLLRLSSPRPIQDGLF
jgi:integrase